MAGEIANAFVTLLPAVGTGFASKVSSEITPAAARAGDEAGRAAGSRFSTGFGSMIKGLGVAFAGAAVLDFGKDAFAEAQEAQKAGALTEAVIKSTGAAAGVTADQIGALSQAISNKVGIDDEAIQSGANMLLTFKNIKNEAGAGNDIFNQATQSVTDLSAAMGKDMKSSALLVGKALNDPIAGMSALGRAGVQFTADQKETIKSLVETGDVAGAQKIILGELQSQFGGAAEAMATPADKARITWANLQEQIGTQLMPVLNTLLGWFSSIVPVVARFLPVIAGLGAAFLIYKATVTTITAVTRAWAAVQTVLNLVMSANPIGLVIIGIAALVAVIILAWKKSETFRDIVLGVWNAIKGVVMPIVDWFRTAIPAAWDAIKNATSTAWNAVKSFVSGAWDGIKSLVSGALETVKGWISSAWETVKATTSLAWSGIKSAVSTKVGELIGFVMTIPGKILSALGDLGSLLLQAGKNVIQGLIDGIGSMLGKVGDVMGDVVGKIVDFLPWSPAKEGPLRIKRPEKGGANVGRMFAEGLQSQTTAVAQASRDLAAAAVVTASPTVNRLGALQGAGSGAVRSVRDGRESGVTGQSGGAPIVIHAESITHYPIASESSERTMQNLAKSAVFLTGLGVPNFAMAPAGSR